MPKRRFVLSLALIILCGITQMTRAATLELRVGVTTGSVMITNVGSSDVVLDAYTIDSASASLLPAGWLSVTDNYDFSGDQSVDSSSDWFEISAVGLSLAEGSLTSLSGSLAAGDSVDLGAIWSTTGVEDLSFEFLAGGTLFSSSTVYLLEADANLDQIVDAADFTFVRDSISNPAANIFADVNRDGVVNATDIQGVFDQFGASNPLPPTVPHTVLSPTGSSGLGPSVVAALSVTAVPEPLSLTMLATALASLVNRRPIRRR